MATRYSVEALLFLRESPLCTRPNALPPAEEWMGPPPETFRNNQTTGKTGTDRTRSSGDTSLLDQTNRRPGVDRHMSRNSANPEDIILGPPRTTFSSATLSRGSKPFDNDRTFKDSDRFATFRKNGDGDTDRFRERDRNGADRDGRNSFRRRGDGTDQDSDGWSTVKPRKSFGHEGAERFHGRIGGDRPDRFGGERRARDANPQDEDAERPPRRSNFGEFTRDKEGDDGERPRRNGVNRNRPDQPSWARGGTDAEPQAQPTRERFDRAKSWRERNNDDQHANEKPRERNERNLGRWDRDHRQEREPEWLDEPAEEKSHGHTAEDFQKFMESMKAGKRAGAPAEQAAKPAVDTSVRDAALEAEKSKVKSAPAVEMGPDKFFANFAPTPSAELISPMETPKESAPPKKTGSRFQGFFASQEDRRQTEPSTPAAGPPVQEPNPLLALAGIGVNMGPNAGAGNPADKQDKMAFEAILQKLQKSSITANTPPQGGYPAPAPNQGPPHDRIPQGNMASPGPYQSFPQEPRNEPMNRGPPPPQQRQQQGNQLPPMRTEQQMLQDLLGARLPMPSPGSGRVDPNQGRNSNPNKDFLMSLMQSGRNPSEPPRNEPLLRMPQPSRPAQIPQTPDREPDFQRERSASQHQGRPQGPPGFFDEQQLHHHEQDNRRQQPTQILQRQGPPGLEPMHPSFLQGANQQLPPGPGRPMIPPPGLAGNPRNGPMPGMFPPNFPMGAFPPEAMAGPPRNMPPPPGFFGGPPPPGFMGPPGMAGGFHGGPEALAFGFDGRGMPPPGAANFRRN
ncbi:uncharacterized protein JN550_001128 [Neoarthrinium moseri]|uniref:uncharacterized protein n=1 Tax=Neoarthrinium moseri TaxID=1658444 RepID=UPI001FDBF888|nr:uncharacterized protein JN550_001128 [Neoarthrinium moseri]KAI1877056.1 hypothetical protein JN550_001128 [Neoarthrinium moseri]